MPENFNMMPLRLTQLGSPEEGLGSGWKFYQLPAHVQQERMG